MRALCAVALGFFVAAVGAELLLRFVILSDFEFTRRIGSALLPPEKLFDSQSESDFWKLRHHYLPPARRVDTRNPNAVLGWDLSGVGSAEHVGRVERDPLGRRPIVLYGDSFAGCETRSCDCWEGLVERSEFGATHVLHNLGAGGFGTDQILLALQTTIDRFAGLDPLVIVSVFLDDDFDRAWLDFRDWPKPRLDLVDGELRLREPVVTHVPDFLERHPIEPGLVLRRLLLFNEDAPFAAWREEERDRLRDSAGKLALNRAILETAHAELERRGLEHVFFVFHGAVSLRNYAAFGALEHLVEEVAAESGVPCISSRPYLRAAAAWKLPHLEKLLYAPGVRGDGHYNAAGNEVVFQAFLQLLRGSDGQQELAAARRIGAALAEPGPGLVQPLTVLGRTLLLRMPEEPRESWFRRTFTPKGAEIWGLRAPADRSASVELRLDSGTGISAGVSVAGLGVGQAVVRAEVIVRDDGEVVETLRLSSTGAPVACAWRPEPGAVLAFEVRALDDVVDGEIWLKLEGVRAHPATTTR